ncbi:hypothetical protein D779_1076 [Imhoffiella purpurea]|uniref:Uncharacterized protein n=1 Tax=Imhoffiella purpurea TaxID=1249627 RepID=W9V7Y2_9GAMM|nr:hypothetical protein D779_1076 [Imhoffiella purpurea]
MVIVNESSSVVARNHIRNNAYHAGRGPNPCLMMKQRSKIPAERGVAKS